MPRALLHLVVCLVLAVIASIVPGVFFGWPPRFQHVARGLTEPSAWSTLLVAGAACAWVSWRQRRAVTVGRAALWGALYGVGIGALGALVGCAIATSQTPSVSLLGCWMAMSLFMAPYVALWLAVFCAWQRWRSA
jgi:hypothetical protein